MMYGAWGYHQLSDEYTRLRKDRDDLASQLSDAWGQIGRLQEQVDQLKNQLFNGNVVSRIGTRTVCAPLCDHPNGSHRRECTIDYLYSSGFVWRNDENGTTFYTQDPGPPQRPVKNEIPGVW